MNQATTIRPTGHTASGLLREIAAIAGGAIAVGGFVFVLFGAFEPTETGLAFDTSSPVTAIERQLPSTVLHRAPTLERLHFETLDQG